MQNTRLYILQVLGILALVFGYFISDAPDSQSEMHFDLSSVHTIRATGTDRSEGEQYASLYSHDKSSHKGRSAKYFSFKVIIPRQLVEYHYVPMLSVTYVTPLSDSYYYLFSKEINPPPPKSC